ncbi:hypothetical protein D9M72_371790 [compost metagenome]
MIDPVKTVVGADTGADVVLALFHDLAHDMRIGHVSAGHADHVNLAGSDRVTSRRHVLDLCGMEGREFGCCAYIARKIQMRRARHALDRDDVGQARIRIDMTTDDIQKIDETAFLQTTGDLQAFSLSGPAGKTLVRRVAYAEDKVVADPFAHRLEDVETETQTVIERAAIGTIEFVGKRRGELVDEMPVGFQLDTIHAARLHAFGGVRKILDDALDVPVFDLLRKGAV